MNKDNKDSHINNGRLYAVGVGPGETELLTLKAARVIRECDWLCYIQNPVGFSLARNIVAPLFERIRFMPDEYAIVVSMTTGRAAAEAAYDRAAVVIAEHLAGGARVAVLCQGDPMFYGSFAYLHARLRIAGLSDDRVEIIPGITSVTAAAALVQQPLGLLADKIALLSARCTDDEILASLRAFTSVAIIKVGLRRAHLLALIAQAERLHETAYIEYAGLPQQRVVREVATLLDPEHENNTPAPYFSLLLVTGREAPSTVVDTDAVAARDETAGSPTPDPSATAK